MPDFHDRRSGSVVRLEPLDHPHLEDTYHPSVEAAHEAAKEQSAHFGGFKYNIHKDGKPAWLGGTAHATERTETAAAYNKNKVAQANKAAVAAMRAKNQ